MRKNTSDKQQHDTMLVKSTEETQQQATQQNTSQSAKVVWGKTQSTLIALKQMMLMKRTSMILRAPLQEQSVV